MKNLFIIVLIGFFSFIVAREEVITNTTVTQDTTVTIIEPPKPTPPTTPPPPVNPQPPVTPPPNPPVIHPPVPTKTVVSTQNIDVFFNHDIKKSEGASNKEMLYDITFSTPLPENVDLKYYIYKISNGFKLGSDIDKRNATNSLFVSKGASNAQIKINIIDDNLYEEDEKFKIVLKYPKKYIKYSDGTFDFEYGYKVSFGTILDNDSDKVVDVNIPEKVAFNEKDANVKDMEFLLKFSKPLNSDVKLKYEIVPKDITLGKDIQTKTKIHYLDLKKSDTETKIKIKVLDDNIYEQIEYFQIKFYPPNSNFHFSKYYTNAEIIDDEISVTISDYVIFSEDEANKLDMKFNIAFSKEIPDDLVLNYTLTPGENLILGQDIQNSSTSGSIVVPQGSKNTTIKIKVLDDNQIEDAEYFTLSLQQPVGSYGFINKKSIGVILDDDVKTDIPNNGGDYIIYETGTTDAKLKTKIVGSITKFDVYATDGFEIFLGKTQEKKKTCDKPVCTITTLACGQQVKQCVTTCYITTRTVLKYSDRMDIDEITLRTFKNYDNTNKQCYGEYPKQTLAKDIRLNSGAKYTFSIPTDKAFRCGWIEVTGHSQKDANGTIRDFKGISDAFALRPDKFQVDLSGKNLTDPLVAGENVDMKVMAVDVNNQIVNSYSGKNFIEKVIDKFYGDSLDKGLDINGLSFISGLIQTTTKYDEVGELTITVEETSPAYAQIDKDDNPSTYKITPASYKVRVIPDHFNVSYLINDFNSLNHITFIANDPSVMGSSLRYNIKAENKNGIITKRYTDGKYADNVNVKIFHQVNTLPSRNLKLNFINSKEQNNKVFLSSNGVSINETLNKSDFINGIAQEIVYENFSRDNKIAQNPIKLKVTQIDAKEQTGVGGKKVFGSKSDNSQRAFFYYARSHAPSPQGTDSNTLNAKIYYEVYCKNCDKTIFLNANNRSSLDTIYWYILPSSVVSNFGSSVCNYTNPRAINVSTISSISYINNQKLKIVSSTMPSKNKIFYTPSSSFLQYNEFGTFLPEHYFEVSFSAGSSVWAGEGKKGVTVDTDVSKKSNQALEW